MSKKITFEQVQAALEVVNDWVREDKDSRSCVTIVGDLTTHDGFYHVCGSNDNVQDVLIQSIVLSEGIRKAFISDVGMLIGQGILRLRDQIDGSTFPRPEQKGGQA